MTGQLDLLVIGDGRDDYLTRTIDSIRENLLGPVGYRYLMDDSGDDKYRASLRDRYGDEFEVIDAGPRQGFSGAIRHAWAVLTEQSDADWICHWEADFTLNHPVDTQAMIGVLADHPPLMQMALRRQAWNPAEKAAGGVIETLPDAFEDCCDYAGNKWLTHRRWFTTNPSIYSRDLCYTGWPEGEFSEGVFTHQLLDLSEDIRFGYWLSRESAPAVHHIGEERIGVGY